MEQVCKHCYISGYVQGVCFRHYTRKQAIKHGLTGWVRNLDDGRVEVLVCGNLGRVQDFVQWLNRGPSGAGVTGVVVEQQEFQEVDGFEILF